MKFLLLILTICGIIFNASPVSGIVEAQEKGDESNWEKMMAELFKSRNPFKSQLPEPEKPVEPEDAGRPEADRPKRPAFEVRRPDIGIPSSETRESPLPPLEISGLVWNTSRPQAIINGVVVGIGDRIGEITILEITRNDIKVNYNQKEFTIKINR